MDIKMIVCKSCGVAVPKRSSGHLYCQTCRTESDRKVWRKSRTKIRGHDLVYPCKGKCKICKTDIIRENGNHLYCIPCSEATHKQNKYRNKQIATEIMSDYYLSDKLRGSSSFKDLPLELFPKELIDFKRVSLSISRHIRRATND